MVQQVLSGHTSPETAFVVDSYPYGFRLRCQIRYWIETTKHGQRVVSQTTNPKKPGIVWNTPKASTYSPLRVLFLDEQGYVQNNALQTWTELATIQAFEQTYATALASEYDQRVLRLLKRQAEQMAAREAARQAADGRV